MKGMGRRRKHVLYLRLGCLWIYFDRNCQCFTLLVAWRTCFFHSAEFSVFSNKLNSLILCPTASLHLEDATLVNLPHLCMGVCAAVIVWEYRTGINTNPNCPSDIHHAFSHFVLNSRDHAASSCYKEFVVFITSFHARAHFIEDTKEQDLHPIFFLGYWYDIAFKGGIYHLSVFIYRGSDLFGASRIIFPNSELASASWSPLHWKSGHTFIHDILQGNQSYDLGFEWISIFGDSILSVNSVTFSVGNVGIVQLLCQRAVHCSRHHWKIYLSSLQDCWYIEFPYIFETWSDTWKNLALAINQMVETRKGSVTTVLSYAQDQTLQYTTVTGMDLVVFDPGICCTILGGFNASLEVRVGSRLQNIQGPYKQIFTRVGRFFVFDIGTTVVVTVSFIRLYRWHQTSYYTQLCNDFSLTTIYILSGMRKQVCDSISILEIVLRGARGGLRNCSGEFEFPRTHYISWSGRPKRKQKEITNTQFSDVVVVGTSSDNTLYHRSLLAGVALVTMVAGKNLAFNSQSQETELLHVSQFQQHAGVSMCLLLPFNSDLDPRLTTMMYVYYKSRVQQILFMVYIPIRVRVVDLATTMSFEDDGLVDHHSLKGGMKESLTWCICVIIIELITIAMLGCPRLQDKAFPGGKALTHLYRCRVCNISVRHLGFPVQCYNISLTSALRTSQFLKG